MLGCALSLAGSVISNLGLQLEKLAFKRHEVAVDKGLTEKKAAYKLPLWILGFVLMVVGVGLDFGSLALAAQSLLAPLAASTLVINIIQAPCVVGEKPTRLDVMVSKAQLHAGGPGLRIAAVAHSTVCSRLLLLLLLLLRACQATLVIATGCILSVGFADHASNTYSLEMMRDNFLEYSWIGWLAFVTVMMAMAFMKVRRSRSNKQAASPSLRASAPAAPKHGLCLTLADGWQRCMLTHADLLWQQGDRCHRRGDRPAVHHQRGRAQPEARLEPLPLPIRGAGRSVRRQLDPVRKGANAAAYVSVHTCPSLSLPLPNMDVA
eukprot:SAG22_NODE_2981_length_2054_cov_1.827621_1_plen_321_part_00